jgi:hypothetical protein
VLYAFVDALEASGVDREKARAQVRRAVGRSLENLSIDISTLWLKSELNPELLLRPVVSGLLSSASGEGVEVLSGVSIRAICRELKALNASKELLGESCPADAAGGTP